MRTGALLVLALALGACAAAGPHFAPGGEATDDGLRPLAGTRFDRAFARPGLDLSRYERIWLVSEGITYEKPPERPRGSERGQALVRVGDRGEFEATTGLMRSTSITNRIEVRRTFEAWSRLARRGLDELHAMKLPESPA